VQGGHSHALHGSSLTLFIFIIMKVRLIGRDDSTLELILVDKGFRTNPEWTIIGARLVMRKISRVRASCRSYQKKEKLCKHPKIGLRCIGVNCGHFLFKNTVTHPMT
jgi:hypothetical protein